MKRIFSILLVALFMFVGATQGWAEFSKTAVTGTNYSDSQVFLNCYYAPKNSDMPTLTKNSVVILATGSSLASTNSTMGIYVTTTNTRHVANVFGVTDADIASNTVGRICIRGAHLVRVDTANTVSDITNGWMLSVGNEDGKANNYATQGTLGYVITGGVLGIKIGDTAETDNLAWVYVNPGPILR